MRKILLLLTILVSCTGMLHAAESVVTITPADMKASNSSTSYVTTAFEFTADGSQFKANQVNPTSGQMKVNAVGASGFTLYNTSAIENITKVEVTADASTLGTWYMATGSTAITAAVTTSTANAVKGSISGTVITFEPSQENASYFHINLTSKGSQTVKFTTIKVYYGEAGPDIPAEPVDYTCADFTDKALEVGTTYTLDLGTSHPDINFKSSNTTIASIDNGVITANSVGTAIITASWDAVEEAFNAGSATFTVTVEKPAPTVTDELVWTNFTTTSGSAYMSAPKTYTSPTTGITYSALFAPNKYFQFRSKESDSGIVTTANPKGYVLKSVQLAYASGSGEIDFYGDNTAYSAPSDLYATTANGNKIKGTSIGSLSNNGTCEVTAGSFNFFGLRSSSGARYISKITLVWELVEAEPVDYTALNNLTIDDLFPGDTRQLPLGEKFPADMIMISNNESVVTVTDEGLLTAVAPGTTTISVEWDADEVNNFTAGNAEINVTVKKPLETASMSFLHNVVYGKLGVGVVGQAAYYNGNGKVEYKSSDETILKVNPTTGMITKADVLRTGEVTITATAPETPDFKAATASYTIIVQDPNEVNNFDSDQAMFIFNEEEAYGMALFTTTNSSENNVQIYETGVTSINNGPVTLNFTGDYRHWYNSATNIHLRAYSAATMTFSVPEGYYITKITLNQTQGNYTALVSPDSETEIGKLSNGSADGASQKIWEALDSEGNDINLSSVTLKVGMSPAHSRIQTMTVVWKKTASEQEPAKLSFSTTLYNDLVGTDINVNAVNNPNNVPVAYSIDNLEEGSDYTITENGENLTVNVNKTGVYTLRAKSNATDEYLPGIAILRLNVFPAVELKLNDGEAFDLTEKGEIVLPEEGGSFTIEGNYPNTVRIWYALNSSADESLYDGTPVEFTDDATLTYHLEYAETDRYRYTTNHTICVTPPAPECNVAHGEEIPADATLTFTSKEGTTLLYRVSTTLPAAYSAMRAPAATAGWDNNGTNNYSFDASELPAGTSVLVSTKALHSNGRIESAETARAFTVGSGTVTGVENIEAAADNAPVEFFNLQGIRVANPANGIYIRRQGNTVEKVTLNN